MFGFSLGTYLAMAWAFVTVVFVVLVIWRSLLGMKEDDQIFLDEIEDGLAREQREVVARLKRITKYVKGFGFASAGLLLVILALSVVSALSRSDV
ncbi:MAG: hypothetical protein FJW26_05470 [Acidimicrobiia bacterium]|nr:hypothetical protein [Acidimicrobiia bacterium]